MATIEKEHPKSGDLIEKWMFEHEKINHFTQNTFLLYIFSIKIRLEDILYINAAVNQYSCQAHTV